MFWRYLLFEINRKTFLTNKYDTMINDIMKLYDKTASVIRTVRDKPQIMKERSSGSLSTP